MEKVEGRNTLRLVDFTSPYKSTSWGITFQEKLTLAPLGGGGPGACGTCSGPAVGRTLPSGLPYYQKTLLSERKPKKGGNCKQSERSYDWGRIPDSSKYSLRGLGESLAWNAIY